MRSMKHPLTSVIYELDDDGNVRLTDGDRTGTFDRYGRWLSGERLIRIQRCASGSAPVRVSRPTSARTADSGTSAFRSGPVPMSTDEVQTRSSQVARAVVKEIIEADSRPGTAILREERPGWFGDHDIAVARYTSRSFHELEKQRLWDRVWQMACREEEIPEVGDTTLYEICDRSILLVRSAAEEIRAFWNSCRHRGWQLAVRSRLSPPAPLPLSTASPGTWTARSPSCRHRGTSRRSTSSSSASASSRVGVWAGFVFVNPDPDCDDLMTFLGDLDEHFAEWTLEDRYIEGHTAKTTRRTGRSRRKPSWRPSTSARPIPRC